MTNILSTVDLKDAAKFKEILEALEAALEFSNSLIDSMQDGFVVLDKDGRISNANPALCHLTGFSRKELIGLSAPFPYWPPEEYEAIQAAFQKTLKDEVNRFELTFMRKSGERFPVTVSPSIIKDSDGSILSYMATVKDNTEHMEALKALRSSEVWFRSIFENTNTCIASIDSKGRVTHFNEGFRALLGYNAETLKGMNFADFTHPDDLHLLDDVFQEILANKRSGYHITKRYIHRDGHFIWVDLSAGVIRDAAGEVANFVAVIQDITDRKLAEQEIQLAALVYQASSEAMVVCDDRGIIIMVNPAFTQITGYTPAEAIGKMSNFLRSSRYDEAHNQFVWQSVLTTGAWRGEVWNRRKSGEDYPTWVTINITSSKDGSPIRYVVMFSDITRQKESEALIWNQANFDALTGLPNRRMLHDRLTQEIRKAQRNNLPLALMFLDLDRFKEVNDTLGHDVGDTLLKDAALRLISCVRESDTVARSGGDEFIVILSELSDLSSVDRIAEKILEKLAEPFQLGDEKAYVSVSIGITFYPDDADQIDVLLKNADQAMYAAKHLGRNRYCYFTPAMQEAAQLRMRLSADLRAALATHQFMLYYQPIVDMTTGTIHKAEALIRWQHPTRGWVSPADFIPIAEDSGLIVDIGDWVFQEVGCQAARWCASLHAGFQISVNASPVQFKTAVSRNWVEYLQRYGLSGKNIAIEITEGLLLDASAAVTDQLLAFRDAGTQVSIDDFGTGYSALSYLKKFDIDFLKIDQSFVRNLAPNSDDMALCEAIILMAHKLGIKVIAEGVETTDQRDLLAAAGCDYAQGYLYSRPIPSQDFEKLLLRKTPLSRDGIA